MPVIFDCIFSPAWKQLLHLGPFTAHVTAVWQATQGQITAFTPLTPCSRQAQCRWNSLVCLQQDLFFSACPSFLTDVRLEMVDPSTTVQSQLIGGQVQALCRCARTSPGTACRCDQPSVEQCGSSVSNPSHLPSCIASRPPAGRHAGGE